MFERFTDRARRVVVLAQEHARGLNHDRIGTEHLLLGVLDENGGVAPRVFEALGVERATLGDAILAAVRQGTAILPTEHIPFTPRAKRALEGALREAVRMGHRYIGVEHILVALAAGTDGIAAEVLRAHGLTVERIRPEVVRLCGTETVERLAEAAGAAATQHREAASAWVAARTRRARRLGPKCPSCGAALARESAYEIVEVPEFGGDGTAKVLYLFCVGCGHVLDTMIAPDD